MSATRCFCGPTEYGNCWDQSCPNAGRVYQDDADDEPDTLLCDFCDKAVPAETTVRHDGVNLCVDCDAGFHDAFAHCVHEWTEHYGEWGPGQICTRCYGFIAHDDAADLFPLICDGWIPEPVA